MAEKTRYSDEELVEFRDLILEKLGWHNVTISR